MHETVYNPPSSSFCFFLNFVYVAPLIVALTGKTNVRHSKSHTQKKKSGATNNKLLPVSFDKKEQFFYLFHRLQERYNFDVKPRFFKN